MNNLGFAIKYAHQGASMPLECNSGSWVQKVIDIREYLKLFTGLATYEQGSQVSTGKIITFLSYDEWGCYICQFKAVNGRGGDFCSGWIYIPNTIEIQDEDIMETYNYVKEILKKSNLKDEQVEIKRFFSKLYNTKEKDMVAPYGISQGEQYCIRYLDEGKYRYSLKDIIGSKRYQSDYTEYKAVFLIDKNDGVNVAKEEENKFVDVTDEEIFKTCVIIPPAAPSKGRHRSDFNDVQIRISLQEVFSSPILMMSGKEKTFYVTRDGFEPQKVTIEAKEERQKIDLSEIKLEPWKKKISFKDFKIRTDDGKDGVPRSNGSPQSNYTEDKTKSVCGDDVKIFVNDKDVTHQEVLFKEEECKKAHVVVEMKDYERYEETHNLLEGNCGIDMVRKEKEFHYSIILKNRHRAELTLTSKYLGKEEYSPLEGYKKNEQCLKLDQWFVWKQRIYGFGAAAIIFLCVCFAKWYEANRFEISFLPLSIHVVPRHESVQTSGTNSNAVLTEQSEDKDSLLVSAVEYLDNHVVWKKLEMEKNPKLEGLFDDMNDFKLDNLDHKRYLSSSEQFKKVVEAAKKNSSNEWNPRQEPHNPTYIREGDEGIDVNNYIDWLSSDHTSKQSEETSTNSSRKNTGAQKNHHDGKTGKTGGNSESQTSSEKEAQNGGL